MEGEVWVGWHLAARLRRVRIGLPVGDGDAASLITGALADIDDFWIGERPMRVRVRDEDAETWLEWSEAERLDEGVFRVVGTPVTRPVALS